eukprot:gene2341-3629_t
MRENVLNVISVSPTRRAAPPPPPPSRWDTVGGVKSGALPGRPPSMPFAPPVPRFSERERDASRVEEAASNLRMALGNARATAPKGRRSVTIDTAANRVYPSASPADESSQREQDIRDQLKQQWGPVLQAREKAPVAHLDAYQEAYTKQHKEIEAARRANSHKVEELRKELDSLSHQVTTEQQASQKPGPPETPAAATTYPQSSLKQLPEQDVVPPPFLLAAGSPSAAADKAEVVSLRRSLQLSMEESAENARRAILLQTELDAARRAVMSLPTPAGNAGSASAEPPAAAPYFAELDSLRRSLQLSMEENAESARRAALFQAELEATRRPPPPSRQQEAAQPAEAPEAEGEAAGDAPPAGPEDVSLWGKGGMDKARLEDALRQLTIENARLAHSLRLRDIDLAAAKDRAKGLEGDLEKRAADAGAAAAALRQELAAAAKGLAEVSAERDYLLVAIEKHRKATPPAPLKLEPGDAVVLDSGNTGRSPAAAPGDEAAAPASTPQAAAELVAERWTCTQLQAPEMFAEVETLRENLHSALEKAEQASARAQKEAILREDRDAENAKLAKALYAFQAGLDADSLKPQQPGAPPTSQVSTPVLGPIRRTASVASVASASTAATQSKKVLLIERAVQVESEGAVLDADARVHAAEGLVRTQQQALLEAEARAVQADAIADDASASLASAQSVGEKLRSRVAVEEKRAVAAEARLAEVLRELEAKRASSMDRLEATAKLDDAAAEAARLAERLAAEERLAAQLRQAVEKEQAARGDLSAFCEQLGAELQRASDDLREAHDRLANEEERAQAAEEYAESTRQALEAVQEELRVTKLEESEALEKERQSSNAVQSTLSFREAELDASQAMNEELTAERDKLHALLTSATDRTDDSLRRLTALEAELDSRESNAKLMVEDNKTLQARNDYLTAELRSVQQQLAHTNTHAKQTLKEMADKSEAMEALATTAIKEAKQAKEKANAELAELSSENERLRREADSLRNEGESLQEKVAEAEGLQREVERCATTLIESDRRPGGRAPMKSKRFNDIFDQLWGIKDESRRLTAELQQSAIDLHDTKLAKDRLEDELTDMMARMEKTAAAAREEEAELLHKVQRLEQALFDARDETEELRQTVSASQRGVASPPSP